MRSLQLSALIALLALGLASFSSVPSGSGQEPFPDLTLSKTASPDSVRSGEKLTYTILVSNIGGAPAGPAAFPIRIVDLIPAQFTVQTFDIQPTGTCMLTASDLRCEIETLGAGESATISVSGTATVSQDVVMHNQALVDLPVNHISELVEVSNNIASLDTTVLGPLPVGGISLDGGLSAPQDGRGERWMWPVIAALAASAMVVAGSGWYVYRRR